MIARSSGRRRLTRSFVRRPSRAGPETHPVPVHAPVGDRGHELLAAEHALELVAALGVVEHLDPRVGRVAGDLLDAKCRSATLAICGRWVIVSTCARSASRRRTPATRCAVTPPMPASISSKHERLAARDGGERERDARELSARGGLGDRPERQARVGPDQEDGLVGARRAGLALAQLDAELALAHADVGELAATASANGPAASRRAAPSVTAASS